MTANQRIVKKIKDFITPTQLTENWSIPYTADVYPDKCKIRFSIYQDNHPLAFKQYKTFADTFEEAFEEMLTVCESYGINSRAPFYKNKYENIGVVEGVLKCKSL